MDKLKDDNKALWSISILVAVPASSHDGRSSNSPVLLST